MPPVHATERIAHLKLRQETAAMRDFDPAYDRSGSTLLVLPGWLPRQKSLRFLPYLPEGRNSPFVPILTVAANIPDRQLGARYLPVKSTRGF
jgi:hypothetical protein